MPKAPELRALSRTAKRGAGPPRRPRGELADVIRATAAIWRRHHLIYDQVRAVSRAVRAELELARPERRPAVARLGHEATTTLIAAALPRHGAGAAATTAMVRASYERAMVASFTRGRFDADRGEARGAPPDRGDSDTRPARAPRAARAPRGSSVDRAPGSRSPRGQVGRPAPRRGGATASGQARSPDRTTRRPARAER
jgi:hypothetical protein